MFDAGRSSRGAVRVQRIGSGSWTIKWRKMKSPRPSRIPPDSRYGRVLSYPSVRRDPGKSPSDPTHRPLFGTFGTLGSLPSSADRPCKTGLAAPPQPGG